MTVSIYCDIWDEGVAVEHEEDKHDEGEEAEAEEEEEEEECEEEDEEEEVEENNDIQPDSLVTTEPLGVLVVDDNVFMRNVVKSMLRGPAVKVVEASDGKEAVDIVTSGWHKIDAVIMDRDMPIMNGLEATRAIREWEQLSLREPLRILGLSAAVMEKDIAEGLNAGMDVYLTKPVSKGDLLSTISSLLNQ
eukprot:GILI01008421.1.p2 GENE.GILI01008421.1~~GILI01008421.1.p2  ORF type:complete len:191 (+),score=48.45 GILI01008421.1:326-898(+)